MPYRFLLSVFCLFVLAGCTSFPKPEGKPVAEPTFQNYEPVLLNISTVDIVNQVALGQTIATSSNSSNGNFVYPVDIAISNYANARFQGNGTPGRFVFEILDARQSYRLLEQDNAVLRFTQLGREDEYRFNVILRLTPYSETGLKRESVTLNFERTLILPNSLSIAEREKRQVEFLEKFIREIDDRVIGSLSETLYLL